MIDILTHTHDLPQDIGAVMSAWGIREWHPAAIAEALGVPGTILLTANLGPHLGGFLLLRIAGDFADVLFVFADPSRRRSGIGKALVNAAQREAESRGAGRLVLEVRVGNAAAIALYEQAGFRPVTTKKRYYADNEDALVMIREATSDATI